MLSGKVKLEGEEVNHDWFGYDLKQMLKPKSMFEINVNVIKNVDENTSFVVVLSQFKKDFFHDTALMKLRYKFHRSIVVRTVSNGTDLTNSTKINLTMEFLQEWAAGKRPKVCISAQYYILLT